MTTRSSRAGFSRADTGQATPGHRWFAIGAVLGVLLSGVLVTGWHRDSVGLSVTVLGAGRQAAVLITHHHRRILIASGTNGSAFANALADALPPIDKQIDLVLIDPDASADVRERARSLRARLIWSLPGGAEPVPPGTIERSFAIDLDERTSLLVEIGISGSWRARLVAPAGSVVILSGAAPNTAVDQHSAVVILTREVASGVPPAPLIVSVPGIELTAEQQAYEVSPGATARLDFAEREIRLASD